MTRPDATAGATVSTRSATRTSTAEAVAVARSWTAMHPVGISCAVWLTALPIVVLAARGSIEPPFSSARSGSVPTVLLLPLLAAAGATFALQHGAPQLLAVRTRGLGLQQALWSVLCLLPGAALAALGALRADQVTVLAAERNALLLTGVTLAGSLVMPVALSPLLALLYQVACMYYAAASNAGFAVPAWAVLNDRVTTRPQFVTAVVVCSVTLVLHHLVRDRRRT